MSLSDIETQDTAGHNMTNWLVSNNMNPNLLTASRNPWMSGPGYNKSPIEVNKMLQNDKLGKYKLANATPESAGQFLMNIIKTDLIFSAESKFLYRVNELLNQIENYSPTKLQTELSNWNALQTPIKTEKMQDSLGYSIIIPAIASNILRLWKEASKLEGLATDEEINSIKYDIFKYLIRLINKKGSHCYLGNLYVKNLAFFDMINSLNTQKQYTSSEVAVAITKDEALVTADDIELVGNFIFKTIVESPAGCYSLEDIKKEFYDVKSDTQNRIAAVALAYTRLLVNLNSVLIEKHQEIFTAFYTIFSQCHNVLVNATLYTKTPDFEVAVKKINGHMRFILCREQGYQVKLAKFIAMFDSLYDFCEKANRKFLLLLNKVDLSKDEWTINKALASLQSEVGNESNELFNKFYSTLTEFGGIKINTNSPLYTFR